MVMRIPFTSFRGFGGSVAVYLIFAFWAALTLSILVKQKISRTHVPELACLRRTPAVDPLAGPDGGPVRIPAHPPSALGGVPVQVL